MNDERWIGWHFLPDDGKTAHRNRSKVEVGKTYSCRGPLELCENGMHGSKRALDSLKYAPGAIVCRVELLGERLDGDDKACARSRKVLAMADATNVLQEFACWCVEQALLREREAGCEPDARSWAAIEAKRKWLRHEITDDELDAAFAAAWAAAFDAASAAAWAAAFAAAWATAFDAARDAASAAAFDAASAAAWAAAWDAMNTELEARLLELLGGDSDG